MRAFNIGQQVWVHRSDLSIRMLHLSFYVTEIKEIVTSENTVGVRVQYLLSNGDSKKEEELFASKEDAIDSIIILLEEEKGHE